MFARMAVFFCQLMSLRQMCPLIEGGPACQDSEIASSCGVHLHFDGGMPPMLESYTELYLARPKKQYRR